MSYKHGLNDNQITDGVATYTWNFDSFNRLADVVLPGASASFLYDPMERLARTTVNGTPMNCCTTVNDWSRNMMPMAS
ncbi:hypothetical protein QO207_28005 [Pseudomonas sp. CAN2814]|uniref:hypothetical protein n=1 Tax=Pseudomonas sp. CAN1 TaxID=3046726 RepID=UPI002647B731|nr:hypothetical protein [Pseudomonas sp. CAN1]MDN6860453.1 hypothetical protein [Pseudomonas sp. CAN1]